MFNYIAIFIGGGLGSLCRYGLSQYIENTVYPWATLLANTLACLALGLALGYSNRHGWTAPWKLFVATGFCGGFSTFSTFSNEVFTFTGAGLHWSAFAYMGFSLLVGMLSLQVGFWVSS